jgi:tetratricopeptide (TPR) repeat protein
MKKAIPVLTLVLVLAACGPGVNVALKTAAPTPEAEKLIQEAGLLAGQGTYTALKNACRIYADLSGQYGLKSTVAAGYFRAAFLLGLRAKELGISSIETFTLAGRLVKENPTLAGYQAWMDIAGRISPRVKGVMKDFVLDVSGYALGDAAKRQLEDLRLRAAGDELIAYLYLTLTCPNKSPYDKIDETTAILAAFPGSRLLTYRAAFCPQFKTEIFEELLKAEPEFWEVRGFLAEAALGKGEVLTAEGHLLAAAEHIPESPYYQILLASIYFFTEEFERSIEYCDKSIALAPEYRDAFLTKAICLSQLGRYPEAIGVLDRIIEMQYYLQGEAHYWLAWNHHALKDLETAQVHVEGSKGRLPTNSEVFGLAGTIALEKKETDRAEKEFTEALKHNSQNSEALFGLAHVAELRQKWPDAAGYYVKAAGVVAAGETSLRNKIVEIKASLMTEARKAKMLAKKETQIRIAQATRATAFMSGAVAWFNAGNPASARDLANRAAEHPQFKDQAAELLAKIKV